MSMYADYIKEKTDHHIYETEQGFATYRYLNEKQVHIMDVYIIPDFRRSGTASAIGDAIVDIAKLRGCTELIGSVIPSTKNSTDSLKFLLSYGFKLDSSAHDLIVLKKEIV